MIWDIYNALIADGVISDLVGDRIKFYEYPEAKSMTETHIVIDPLDTPKASDFADDKWLTDEYLYQIDVWSKDLKERDLISEKIRHIMWSLNFKQTDGIDEYDKDYDVFRVARRYKGKAYRKDFNNL